MQARKLWVVFLTFASVGAVSAESTESTNKGIVRLSPARFSSLPPSIKRELERRGCTIPQYWGAKAPLNVISGSFAKAGQKDHAVLCSRDGASEIEVFWGGTARCPSPVPGSNESDETYLQTGSRGDFEYSRAIDEARLTRLSSIAEYQQYSGSPKAPSNNHEGIENTYIGKGSTILYCHQGSWVELPGSD